MSEATIEERFAEIARGIAQEEINRVLDLITQGIASAREHQPPAPPVLHPVDAELQAVATAERRAPKAMSAYIPLVKASEITGRPQATIYSAIKAGHLAHKKINRRVLVKADDLTAWGARPR